MGNNNQEHRITYKAGITRTPSDFLCQDGDLAECINLATDNEELKPVVQPAVKFQYANPSSSYWPAQPASRVLYVHTYNTEKRYLIIYAVSEGSGPWFIKWTNNGSTINDIKDVDGSSDLTFLEPDIKITSVGKTLIISASDGIHYILWQNTGYKTLGDLPSPDITFFLNGTTGLSPGGQHHVANSQSCVNIIGDNGRMAQGKQKEYNDLITGLYLKNKKAIAQKKAFCEPFFVRAAIELYDGTYTHITQPILLFPAISNNTLTSINDETAYMTTRCCKLFYVNNTNLEAWSDIVRSVTVFISDGIDIYDLNVDQPNSNTEQAVIQNAIFSTSDLSNDNKYYDVSGSGYRYLKMRESSEVLDDIKSLSVFYKLCEIEKNGDGTTHDIAEFIEVHTLENLTTRSRLEYDDYYSRNKMIPSFIYSYNSRLNIANVSRGFFEGFDNFLPYDNDASAEYRFYVTIKTDTGAEITVRHEPSTLLTQIQGIYFFYPDPRATHVMIFKKKNDSFECVLNAALKEHPGLNGAIYMDGLPTSSESESTVTGSEPSFNNNATEMLGNYIITSEVNNPWVFKAEGYNKVGTGEIIGICDTTMALSQDAYGRSDLIVFSKTGIWGMSVDNTGLFQSIHPFSRDVCENANSITKVDWGLFFVSKKGLMYLDDKGVKCVSEQMNGVTFNTSTLTGLATGTEWATIVSQAQSSVSFLNYIRSSSCFLAYDYIDSRIHIINPTYSFSFIFDMASGTISKNILPSAMKRSVGDYPDYILQGTTLVNGIARNCIYSFYDKPREEEVATRSTAFLLTRPMKFSGPVTKDSLRQLMNVGTWNKDAGSIVATKIYQSDDMVSWYEATSRFGAAAKYYRIALFIKMLPSERLSGTILTTQSRRTDNMR